MASHATPGTLPNLRHLVLFDEVVRRGSVSATARAAHLSQPAVTQAVSHIESALGARLMERSYSGLALTGAGHPAAARIERALQMLREALLAARTRSGGAPEDVLSGITSTQLNALIAVVESGAFARAARRAGRARAAVHRAARQLEKSLGTELFEVTSFGVRPTREAEKLALRTRLAFAEIAQGQAEVAAAEGTGSGSTTIGAMPLARSVLVARAVLEFAQTRPEHGISILDGPYESMLGALRRGGADVLVGALRDPCPPKTSCRSTCLMTRWRSSLARATRWAVACRPHSRTWRAFRGSRRGAIRRCGGTSMRSSRASSGRAPSRPSSATLWLRRARC